MQITSDVTGQQNYSKPTTQKTEQVKQEQPTQAEVTQKVVDDNIENASDRTSRIEDLVSNLNRALDPFNNSLRFGYDDNFHVSLIDTHNDKVIHRFPDVEAESFLPKMQEVMGILFDQKG
jgi:flagellar protein FlaG